MAWVKATSNTWNNWVNPLYAYDDDTGSNAYHSIANKSWTDYLELFRASISCSKIRIWTTRESTWINSMQVDVQYESAWHNIFDDAIGALGEFVEFEIGSVQDVTGLRVRYYNNHNTQTYMVYCWETDFWQEEVIEYLVGVINGVASVGGSAKITKKLSGSADGVALVSGITKAVRKIAGIVNGVAGVSGFTRIVRKIAGATDGVASVVGALTVTTGEVIEWLAGVISGSSQVSGSAKITKKVAGVVSGVCSVSAVAKIGRRISGIVSGVAGVDGVAKITKKLNGISDGVASVIGNLTVTGAAIIEWLAGVVSGNSVVSGTIKASRKLSGNITGSALVNGLVGIMSGMASVVGALTTRITLYEEHYEIVDRSTVIIVRELSRQVEASDVTIPFRVKELKR